MTTPATFARYKAARAKRMPHYIPRAIDAWRCLKYERDMTEWRDRYGLDRYISDGDTIDAGNGYTIKLSCKPDDIETWRDITEQGYDIDQCRKYHGRPEFSRHGDFTRHSGDGFRAWLDVGKPVWRQPDWWLFDLPEKWVRQFYQPRQWSRHEAYVRMVASARLAVFQDIKSFLQTETYVIAATLYDPEGKEVDSDSLGGVDEDYVETGAAWEEHGLVESMLKRAAEDYAKHNPEAVPANYEAGAFV